ncbi:alpha/beta hydrolase [Paenibacillus sp. J31TS4]|uniref:alpha/beta fold hydrolase n=1 Tax=Paenibacillus sp. J31TS4 TaxID=2807195 RepID=UPI001B0B3EFC|nr:alpha/beta hydrolase [Paenibacillus sp. J31TS4]GIP40915.1 alpha/beta hydrolase [Paenibacillus sp. J31TS4]
MNKKNRGLKNGTELAYLTRGEGSEALVLLHGFCGSSAYWEPVLPHLPPELPVLVPDLRGHGDSSAPEGPYSMEGMAEDLALLFEELGLTRVVLLGHSLGGYVTLAFAEQTPKWLAGFGLVHSTPLPDDKAGKAKRDASIETIRSKGMETFAEGLIPNLFTEAYREDNPQSVAAMTEVAQRTSPAAAIAALQGMKARPDRSQVIERAALPVLLIAGEGDSIAPPAKAFAAAAPSGVQTVLSHSAHMGMFEETEEMARVVGAFARKALDRTH